MKFFAKIGSLVLGIVLGVVLTFGGIGLGGYIAVTREGMVGTILDAIPASINGENEVPEEIKAMSLLSYGKNVFGVLTSFSTSEFGAIEDALGFSISQPLAAFVGVDKEVIRKSTVSTVFSNLLNSFTVKGMTEKFGITLPNMPMFQEAEFLNRPMVEAFNYLSSQLDVNNLTVRELNTKFGINLLDGEGGGIFANLLDTKLSNLGEEINQLKLGSVIDVSMQSDVDMYYYENVADTDGLAVSGVDNDVYAWLKNQNYGSRFVAAYDPAYVPIAYDPSTMTYGENVGDFDYFAPIFDIDENDNTTVTTAKEIQEAYITAYNAVETNTIKMTSFVEWAKENAVAYDAWRLYGNALDEDRSKALARWESTVVKTAWLDAEKYLTEPASAETLYANWLAVIDAEGNYPNAGKSRAEWLNYYWLDATDGQYAVWEALEGNADKTVEQYKTYLYEEEIAAWIVANTTALVTPDRYDWAYANYMPMLWAPMAQPVLVPAASYGAPEKSSPVLTYLYDAQLNQMSTKIDTMTVADIMVLDDSTHFLLKEIKNSTLTTMANDMTTAINNASFKQLMNIITYDDVEQWHEMHTADLAGWLAAKTAYDPDNPTAPFDYFATEADRVHFIANTVNGGGESWFVEWDWKAENPGYYDFDGNFYPDESGKVELWGVQYRANTADYDTAAAAWLLANSNKCEHDYITEQYTKAYAQFTAIAGNETKTETDWLREAFDLRTRNGGGKNAWARAYIAETDALAVAAPTNKTFAQAYADWRAAQLPVANENADTKAQYLESRYNALYTAWTAPEGATKTEALWLKTVYDIAVAPYDRFTPVPVAPIETADAAPVVSSSILIALSDSTSLTLGQDVDKLCISDLYEVSTVGVLSIVSPYTTVNELPTAIGMAMVNTSLIRLIEKEVFTYDNQKWSEMTTETRTLLQTRLGTMTVPEMIARYMLYYTTLDTAGLLPPTP